MTVMMKEIGGRNSKGVTDLITRPMGKKYFNAAGKIISNANEDEVVIMDFDGIKVIDPSFADEFLIKMLDQSFEKHFYLRLRNLGRSAESNIKSVVGSYARFAGKEYALAVENITEEGTHYIGSLTSDEEQVLEFVRISRSVAPEDLPQKCSLSEEDAQRITDHLISLRLLRKDENGKRIMPVL